MTKEFKLTVTYIQKIKSSKFGNKILATKQGPSYVYYGETKSQCLAKARRAYRDGSSYIKKWEVEIYED